VIERACDESVHEANATLAPLIHVLIEHLSHACVAIAGHHRSHTTTLNLTPQPHPTHSLPPPHPQTSPAAHRDAHPAPHLSHPTRSAPRGATSGATPRPSSRVPPTGCRPPPPWRCRRSPASARRRCSSLRSSPWTRRRAGARGGGSGAGRSSLFWVRSGEFVMATG